MNSIANSLLALLLSWMRSLFGSILSLMRGENAGFLSWIGSHWLPLACILMLAGITADAVVYILRWRPQYVWRTRFRHLMNRRQLDDAAEEQFQQGFEDAVEDFNFEDTPIPDLTTQSVPPLEEIASFDAAVSPDNSAPFDYSKLPGAESPADERRRRSDRHARRGVGRAVSRFRLPDLSDSDRYSTSYPEMPVNPREAFHAPVYPAAEYQELAADADEDNDHA